MKNVTVTLDEDLARRARVWAAERDISLSRFLARILEERMRVEESYDRAMADFLRREPVVLKRAGRYPTRDEVHER